MVDKETGGVYSVKKTQRLKAEFWGKQWNKRHHLSCLGIYILVVRINFY